MSEALLKTIEPARKPFLPARAYFLSGLTSDLSPWSMRDLAEVMIRVLPPKTNVWTLVNAMKDVGDAEGLFAVAHRLEPAWRVSYEDAAAAVSKSIEPLVRDGKVKVARERWRQRMGGDMGVGPVWMIGANLRGAKLARRDLLQFNLSGADLEGANLEEAKITIAPGANFSGAHAPGLSAMDADLTGARFVGADLSGANFRRAEVVNADFRSANLSGALLTPRLPAGDARLVPGVRTITSPFMGTRMDGANLGAARFEHNNERSAPWWSDKNPVFRGTPSGYSVYKILGGTALAKIDVPF